MGVIEVNNPIIADPTVTVTEDGGDAAIGREIAVSALSGTKAYRQGALNVQLGRAADQADTVWDGNPDTGLLIQARNYATGNAAAEGAVRGLNVIGRNSGTNINWVLGVNVSTRNDSGKTASQLHGLDIRIENYGNVADSIAGIDVNLSDENDGGVHTKHGILIRNTDASGMVAADAALKVSHTSTNGFAAFAELATNAGDGAVANTNSRTVANTTEALIVKIGANTRYIPVYAALW